jgi:hypothetical protein
MAKSSKPKRGALSCLGLILLAVLFVVSFVTSVRRPLDKVGTPTHARILKISGTGSLKHIQYRYGVARRGRRETVTSSDRAWAHEVQWKSVGDIVPIVYDEKYPKRSMLGTREQPYGEWRISSLLKQAWYLVVMAVLGLIWAAIQAKTSRR